MNEPILYFFKNISNKYLDLFFNSTTLLGEQYFFILIITFIYWNVSKKHGMIICYTFLFSSFSNDFLKIIFRTQRPFEALSDIDSKRVHTATGYSFPSGHTQGATTFLFSIAQYLNKKPIYIIAGVLSLLVAISRLYLRVHWLVDVIGGLIIGVFISFVLYKLLSHIFSDKKRTLYFLLISLVSLIILFISVILLNYIFLRDYHLKFDNMFKLIGIITGVVSGNLLEIKTLNFSNKNSILKIILVYITGIITMLSLLLLLKKILPDYLMFDSLRYFIIGFWIVFLYPLICLKFKLFNKEVEYED